MPAPLPVLPAALFKPLECDPASCKHPGVPLDSERLSAAVSFLFFREFDSHISTIFPVAKEKFLTMMLKEPSCDSFRAPKDKKYPVNAAEDVLAGLMLAIMVDPILGTSEPLPHHVPWILNHYDQGFRSILQMFVAEVERISGSMRSQDLCLHDILGRIDSCSAAQDLDPTLALPEDSSAYNRQENQASMMILQREQARTKSMPVKKKVARTREEEAAEERKLDDELERSHPPPAPYQAFDTKFMRYLTSNNFLAGHRLVFNHAITPLHLLVHLLRTSDPSTAVRDSPVVSDVMAYCTAPFKTLRDRLAINLAPFLWKEHESRLEPIRNPSPGFLVMVPQAPNRENPLQSIDNTSILFHNAHLVVEYRVCPPDTCSGQAPIVENYPRAEYLIGKLVDLHFTRLALSELDPKLSDHRSKVLIRFLRRLTSFAYESEEDKTRLIALLNEAFVETAVDPANFFHTESASITDVLTIAGATFKYAQKQATGSTTAPCFCDMTHLCDQLEQSVGKVSGMVDELLAKQPDLAALQVKQLQAKAETGIKNGSLKGSMWKGPWKLRSPGFFEFIGKPLNGVMLKEEHRVAFVMGWRHSFAVMGSARLFEESSFAVRLVGRDTTVQQGLEMIILQTLERSLTTDEIENLGKSGATARDPATAIMRYQIETLLDASRWSARLHTAAMRLKLADKSENHFQYSRAVYDCTVALHYGGVVSEGYLHRGIALARLKLWEKAILDLEKVVALEPKNPIAKRELAKAKQERK